MPGAVAKSTYTKELQTPVITPCPYCGGRGVLYQILDDYGRELTYYYAECWHCWSATAFGKSVKETLNNWDYGNITKWVKEDEPCE